MRKFYNTSLFYKILLDRATFLASKNKPTEKNLNYLQMHMSNVLVPISTKSVHVFLRAVVMNILPANMLADLCAGCNSASRYKVEMSVSYLGNSSYSVSTETAFLKMLSE